MDHVRQSKGLARLTALEFHATQTRFAEIAQREARLRQNLTQLSQHKVSAPHAALNMHEAAFAADANVRWQQWVDQRRAVINTELAQVLALKENYRVRLATAFGRDQAAQAMVNRFIQERKTQTARRQSYES